MDPLQGPELVAVSQALLQVQEEIKRCESSIEAALLKVDAALEAREEWLRDFWREQLNSLRKKEEQLRKDKEQLRKEKELLLLERRLLLEREATSSLAPGTAKQEQIFHVIATIPRARRLKGVRGSVYKLAEVLLAMRPEDGSHFIWYDNDDLQIDLYFEFKQKAMEFQTQLDQWNFINPLFQIEEAKVKPIQEVVEQRTLVRVRLKEYLAAESDSPCNSLEDLRGCCSARSGTSIEPDTDLGKHQALERPEWLRVGGCKPYRLHLRNVGKTFGHDSELANDENNMLAGSWQFHQFLDGLNMPSQLPVVALEPGEIKEEVEVEPGHKRRKVMLRLECRDETVAQCVSSMLKPGSEKQGPLEFSTSVLVKNPKTFTECLQWKFDDTMAKWRSAQDMLNAE